MGHLGLTPQSIYKFGSYTVRAKEEQEAEKLLEDAKMLEKIGCFALVLEKIPAHLAAKVAKSISIPVIGIGAGGDVDGQRVVHPVMLHIAMEIAIGDGCHYRILPVGQHRQPEFKYSLERLPRTNRGWLTLGKGKRVFAEQMLPEAVTYRETNDRVWERFVGCGAH